jgi:hypothetical protein
MSGPHCCRQVDPTEFERRSVTEPKALGRVQQAAPEELLGRRLPVAGVVDIDLPRVPMEVVLDPFPREHRLFPTEGVWLDRPVDFLLIGQQPSVLIRVIGTLRAIRRCHSADARLDTRELCSLRALPLDELSQQLRRRELLRGRFLVDSRLVDSFLVDSRLVDSCLVDSCLVDSSLVDGSLGCHLHIAERGASHLRKHLAGCIIERRLMPIYPLLEAHPLLAQPPGRCVETAGHPSGALRISRAARAASTPRRQQPTPARVARWGQVMFHKLLRGWQSCYAFSGAVNKVYTPKLVFGRNILNTTRASPTKWVRLFCVSMPVRCQLNR